jgi:HD-GYP domain-containing protein (c-di-GMP phosphodiesterase class II)
MLGGQAAIAIDNATLFSNLQRSNTEITSAYDATIDGWSRALDMRDHETEGHTQRVTEMTLQLARRITIPREELIHIRRGATLHDIGKMGIPDRILLKPGPLTVEEWDTMRQHPQFACSLLSSIDYLRPAKDIPCYHHERWDGSGYPAGLKEEEIPLPARLFAIVDVYDALTSDRPYRSKWSKQATLQYIKEQSGTFFDPAIVPAFLEMIKDKERAVRAKQETDILIN